MFPSMAGTIKLGIKRCFKCSHFHHKKLNCQQMICPYCQKTHNISQLKEGICPAAHQLTESLRPKDILVCIECRGLGQYERQQNAFILEQEESFRKRVEEWQSQKEKNLELQRPQRIKFKHSLSTSKQTCSVCKGQGVIEKLKFCCFWGCEQCKYRRYMEHPLWSKMKKQSKLWEVVVEEQTNCSICFETVEKGTSTYNNDCSHRFHKHCILKWFQFETKTVKSCPICREKEKQYPADFFDALKKSNQQFERKQYFFEQNVRTRFGSRSRDRNPIMRPKPVSKKVGRVVESIKQSSDRNASNRSPHELLNSYRSPLFSSSQLGNMAQTNSSVPMRPISIVAPLGIVPVTRVTPSVEPPIEDDSGFNSGIEY